MTICISALCEKSSAVVLASDSAVTYEFLSIEFEHSTRKTTLISDRCVALTAGNALAHTELFNMVKNDISSSKSPSADEIVENIKKRYRYLREREIQEKILNPIGFDNFKGFYQVQQQMLPDIAQSIQTKLEAYDYGLEILVAGLNGSKASIYGIVNPGTSICCDAIGFHAIGSGLPHAMNAIIARDWCHEYPLWQTILVVYEAKKKAEKAPGVGVRSTNLTIVTENGVTALPNDRIPKLDEIYGRWKKHNSDMSAEICRLLK